MDIAVSGGKITQIAPDIPAEAADRVLEIRGAERGGAARYVVPGLIDAHVHVANGASSEGVGMSNCDADGEALIEAAKGAARDLGVPLMVHIGDPRATTDAAAARRAELTRFLLRAMEPGDILTHLFTPNAGRVLDVDGKPFPEVLAARANGVILDSALGRGNFGIEVARRQAQIGLAPDTISSDLTAAGQTFHSLLECMAKFTHPWGWLPATAGQPARA
jgi:predicted amidohydrolase